MLQATKRDGTDDDDLVRVTEYFIEVWCTIFEKELELKGTGEGWIKQSDWKSLAVMLVNSVSSTVFDEADTTIENETDMSLYFKTNEALSFLA